VRIRLFVHSKRVKGLDVHHELLSFLFHVGGDERGQVQRWGAIERKVVLDQAVGTVMC
jgi:hypothetical protein